MLGHHACVHLNNINSSLPNTQSGPRSCVYVLLSVADVLQICLLMLVSDAACFWPSATVID